MLGLTLSLRLFTGLPSDRTPDGASDVWEWEDGIGMQFEPGIFALTE